MTTAPTLTDTPVDGRAITIRAHRAEDAQGVLEQSLDPLSIRWTTVPVPFTPEDARHFVEKTMPGGWADDSEWGFAVEYDGRYAGTISLRNQGSGRAEIAYGSHPAVRGTGVMVRALRLMLDWGFTERGLQTVSWWANEGNWASRKVAWRLGFSFDGTLRQWLPHRDHLVDAWVGTLRRDDSREPRTLWLSCPVLSSDGVTLRPLHERDIPRIREAGSDPVMAEWLGFLFPQPYTDEAARRVITKGREMRAAGTGIAWAFTGEDDALAGWVALFNHQPGHAAELGYWAHPDARSRGLTRRAAATAERYAVEGLGLTLLRANIAPDNAASRRLAEALGFEATGVLKQATTVRGEPADLVTYAKLLG